MAARAAGRSGRGGRVRAAGGIRLVEVSDTWFPDRWSEGVAGVEVLLRRLFWHAGLPEVEVAVEDLRGDDPDEVGIPASEVHYVGYEGGRPMFELHRIGRDDLIGILCHEVGAACLDVFGIGRGPGGPFREGAPADEVGPARSALASVATVYLGLGVPAANAAQRAGLARSTWSRSTTRTTSRSRR